MSQEPRVGVNGEPDDFAARYDRMVQQNGRRGAIRLAAAVLAALVLLYFIDWLI